MRLASIPLDRQTEGNPASSHLEKVSSHDNRATEVGPRRFEPHCVGHFRIIRRDEMGQDQARPPQRMLSPEIYADQ